MTIYDLREDGISLSHILARCRSRQEGVTMHESIDSLVEDLFSLDEPWRGRFLILVADRATHGSWSQRLPQPWEVKAWLDEDTGLYRQVSLMLKIWGRSPG